jgi:hypothetical protein
MHALIKELGRHVSDGCDKDTLIQHLSMCACLRYEPTTYTVWVIL